MDIMIEHLKELSKAIPLETAYDWEMPASIPIDIPPDVVGPFSRNIYLKENLALLLEIDDIKRSVTVTIRGKENNMINH